LRRIASSWAGEGFETPSLEDRRRLLHRYLDKMDAGFGGPMNLRTMAKLRKVMGYFSKGMYGAASLRAATQDVGTVEEARDLIDRFFAVQQERAETPRPQ
jgi:tRNA-dihydrouridine synthase